jgi:hypothetical protein
MHLVHVSSTQLHEHGTAHAGQALSRLGARPGGNGGRQLLCNCRSSGRVGADATHAAKRYQSMLIALSVACRKLSHAFE